MCSKCKSSVFCRKQSNNLKLFSVNHPVNEPQTQWKLALRQDCGRAEGIWLDMHGVVTHVLDENVTQTKSHKLDFKEKSRTALHHLLLLRLKQKKMDGEFWVVLRRLQFNKTETRVQSVSKCFHSSVLTTKSIWTAGRATQMRGVVYYGIHLPVTVTTDATSWSLDHNASSSVSLNHWLTSSNKLTEWKLFLMISVCCRIKMKHC